jgi:hypothetical protein
MKLVKAKPDWGVGKLRPFFTWADSHCDGFQLREASSLRR